MLRFIRILYLLKSVWAVLAALLVGSLLILLAGSDPIEAYAPCSRERFSSTSDSVTRW